MTVRLEIDQAALARQFQAGGQVYTWMVRTTGTVATRAKLYAPVDTGYLRNSITTATRTTGALQVTGLVGATAEYAGHVHEGTKPHVIRPRRAGGALRFPGNGGQVFARSVNHPGTRPRPFLRRALQETLPGAL